MADDKEQEQKPTEQKPTVDQLEALAKELDMTPEQLSKKVKNLRGWEVEVNNLHQQNLRNARQPKTPEKPESTAAKEVLNKTSPEIIAAIREIVHSEVDPLVNPLKESVESEMADVVADFLDDHPEVSQHELFEKMSSEELWPDESTVTKRKLKRRLATGLKMLTDKEFDPEKEREKIRAEELEKLQQDPGTRVVDIKPKGGTKPKGDDEKPQSWVTRMLGELDG